MATYYKYAERDADSQVNWAEVGKGLSDMLTETNRVREEKKAALDAAQRETMKYLAETPNGEHVGARQSILEYANMGSNQMRIMKQLMEQGQLDVKDYTIFRQNLTDNTNLAFNANKIFQENYADVMSGVRDKRYSGLTEENYAEVQGFGNWKNIGWQIAPNGTVMAGKMIEQEVDGKKIRTLDKTPGGLRSMDYLNQAIVSKVDFYQYEDKVDSWVDTLGKNTEVSTLLGRIGAQGLSTSLEDVTRKKYDKEGDMEVEYAFIQSENDQIATIVGVPIDAARVLKDSTIFAPNGKQYATTTNEEEAKKNSNLILKVVDPDTGGFKYVISEEQQKDANEFVRTQMRAKYDKIAKQDVVGQVSRDEKRPPSQTEIDLDEKRKQARALAEHIKDFVSGDPEVASNATRALQTYLDKYGEGPLKGSKLLRGERGVEVVNVDGNKKRWEYSKEGTEQDPFSLSKQLVNTFNVDGLDETMVNDALQDLYASSKKPIGKTKAAGYERNVKDEISAKISKEVGYQDFLDNSSDKTSSKIQKLFESYNELKPESKITVDYEVGAGDDIYIYQSGKLIKTLNSDWDGDITQAKKQYSELQALIEKLNADAFLGTAQKAGGAKPKAESSNTSKYNKK
jgi:hypothetical protein